MPHAPEGFDPRTPDQRAVAVPASGKLPAPGQDSTPAVLGQQAAVLRSLSPAARLRLAVEMSEAARGLLRARLVATHPNWDAARLRQEECRLLYASAAVAP